MSSKQKRISIVILEEIYICIPLPSIYSPSVHKKIYVPDLTIKGFGISGINHSFQATE